MTTEQRFTDEEIKARFDAAEAFQDELEAQLLKDCPKEIIDKFRVGDDKELFRVLLIAPGMAMEEGLWHCQSAPDADLDLDLAPAELCLECGPSLPYKYRVRIRTKPPTAEELVEEPMHIITEPESWEQIENWTRALVAMGVVEKDNE